MDEWLFAYLNKTSSCLLLFSSYQLRSTHCCLGITLPTEFAPSSFKTRLSLDPESRSGSGSGGSYSCSPLYHLVII